MKPVAVKMSIDPQDQRPWVSAMILEDGVLRTYEMSLDQFKNFATRVKSTLGAKKVSNHG